MKFHSRAWYQHLDIYPCVNNHILIWMDSFRLVMICNNQELMNKLIKKNIWCSMLFTQMSFHAIVLYMDNIIMYK